MKKLEFSVPDDSIIYERTLDSAIDIQGIYYMRAFVNDGYPIMDCHIQIPEILMVGKITVIIEAEKVKR